MKKQRYKKTTTLDVGTMDKDFQNASNSIDPAKRPLLAILKEVFEDIIESLKKLFDEVAKGVWNRFGADPRGEGLEYLAVKPMVSFAEWMDNWVARVESHRQRERTVAGEAKSLFKWGVVKK